jgi:uncharacterized Zn-binding protein involved in type VI secretion
MPLAAVQGDKNTHNDGQLVPENPETIFINGKIAIRVGDSSQTDGQGDPPSLAKPDKGSPNVFYYGTPAHRGDDNRVCNAKTVVTGQETVFINGE